jgi:uncharacterized membrane protein
MEKKLFIWGIFLILVLPSVLAANFTYTIVGQKTLVEIEMNESEIDLFSFPEDFEYSEEKIKYFSSNLIERAEEKYFFIVKEELHKNSHIKVILPEGSIVEEDFILFPKNYSFSTNGKNIIIEWKNSGEKEILIQYDFPKKINFLFYFFIGLFLVVLFVYLFLSVKQNKKEKYTQNLFREEKKIMKYLLTKKECWTKEISRDLNIPKVRLSRKIRKLEEKGLVKKIPYGNENKIKLV